MKPPIVVQQLHDTIGAVNAAGLVVTVTRRDAASRISPVPPATAA
jgi:hypothetical protein